MTSRPLRLPMALTPLCKFGTREKVSLVILNVDRPLCEVRPNRLKRVLPRPDRLRPVVSPADVVTHSDSPLLVPMVRLRCLNRRPYFRIEVLLLLRIPSCILNRVTLLSNPTALEMVRSRECKEARRSLPILCLLLSVVNSLVT